MICERNERQPLATIGTDSSSRIPITPVASVQARIQVEADVMIACRAVRNLAERLAFSRSAAYHLATAASELATNLLIHAGSGWLEAKLLYRHPADEVLGIELRAEDEGPGIADIALALTDGFSTAGGLGCGLPGVKRLMDDFAIESEIGRGTRIRAVKWR